MPHADPSTQGDEVTQSGPQTYDTNAEFWIEIIRNRRDKYRKGLTNAAVLNAVGEAKGLAVLDAGCGEGYLSRKIAEDGAVVTGVDASGELIKAARAHELASKLPVSFDVGTVDSLPYQDRSFDLVLCNHLMNDLEDPTQTLKEFARVLRPRGRVVIFMLHPCFYNKHAERDQPENNLPTSSYFQARPVTQNFEVDGLRSPVANTSWLRPLESYTEALRESGFVITSLTEPHPTQRMIEEDSWWQSAFSRPLFMLLVAELR
jgi:ubiquinone/menaquinone biosynthesis C-methylase UbiE